MATTQNSPLLALPTELRLQIYAGILDSQELIKFPSSPEDHEPTSLLQTCSQLRHEVNAEYYTWLKIQYTKVEVILKEAEKDLAVARSRITRSGLQRPCFHRISDSNALNAHNTMLVYGDVQHEITKLMQRCLVRSPELKA